MSSPVSDEPRKPFGFFALIISFFVGMSLAWVADDSVMRRKGTCLQQIVLDKGCNGKVVP